MKREDQIKSLQKKLIQRRAKLSQLLDGELMQLHNSDDAVGGDLVDLAVEVDYATVNSTLAEAECHRCGSRSPDRRDLRALQRMREKHSD